MKVFNVLSLALVLVCSFGGSQGIPNFELLKSFHDLEISAESGINKVDQITFALVDTSLFFLQLGKYALYQSYFGPIILFDWVHDFTRVTCEGDVCVGEEVHVELREPTLYNAEQINLTTDFQPTRFNVQLLIPDLFFSSPGYKHEIKNNVTGQTSVGEFSYVTIQDAIYGLAADYQLVPGVGIQVSNVDITLDMGHSIRTIENTYTILANGEVIEEGLKEIPVGGKIMEAWTGDFEGEPLEPQYEKWAEFVINCGLSGGQSNEGCADIEVLKQRKFSDFAGAF